MEKVIVIGTNSIGEVISAFEKMKNIDQLSEKMKKKYDCEEFYVLYPENVEELDEVIEKYHQK